MQSMQLFLCCLWRQSPLCLHNLLRLLSIQIVTCDPTLALQEKLTHSLVLGFLSFISFLLCWVLNTGISISTDVLTSYLFPNFPWISMAAELLNYFPGSSWSSLKPPWKSQPEKQLRAWSVGSSYCLRTAPLVLRDCRWKKKKKKIYAESLSPSRLCV